MVIGFIGLGSMASAMVRGIAAAQLGGVALCGHNPHPEKAKALAESCGLRLCASNREVLERSDMVVLAVKPQILEGVLEEIKAVKEHCGGKLLKVIIETCKLTDAEKIEMCRVVSESGADYIKTSTGFGGGGATREDVALFKAHVAPHVKIKAARDFVALGADRLGTSRIVKAVKAMEQ